MSETELRPPNTVDGSSRTATVALALWAQAGSRALAQRLNGAGIPVMILKGPDLQQRLYGTPAAYPSGDVDFLVPHRDASRARRLMAGEGWKFEQQGVLWRLSGAASYERNGLRIDLHWGLHAAHLPSWAFRRLERAMWRGATLAPSGLIEPDVESLAIFLAVHAAGHPDGRADWGESARIAARLARDRRSLQAIARESRVEAAALSVFMSRRPPRCLLDGSAGRVVWWATWLARGQFLPDGLRDRFRAIAARLPHRRAGGFRLRVDFLGLPLEVVDGVFPPNRVSGEVVEVGLPLVAGSPSPTIVDVGTGSGALALAIARRLPNAVVVGLDVDPTAIECAMANGRRLGLGRVAFYRSDLLHGLPERVGPVDLIMANLPYVPGIVAAKQDWSAPIATVQGSDFDGLGHLRALIRQSKSRLRPGGSLVMQLVDWQWGSWSAELSSQGFRLIEPRSRRPGSPVVVAASWGDAA